MEGESYKKRPGGLLNAHAQEVWWTLDPLNPITSNPNKIPRRKRKWCSQWDVIPQVWDNDWCSAQKIDDHVSLEENQQSKKQKIKRYEETAYYDLEEDDDPLMLHMQRAPQPKGFKIPTWRNMTDLKTLRNMSRTINQSWKYWKQTTRCYVQV